MRVSSINCYPRVYNNNNSSSQAAFKAKQASETIPLGKRVFPTNEVKPQDLSYSRIDKLYNESLKILKKAETVSRHFDFDGKRFMDISEHKRIATLSPVKNKEGQNCWLEFSSTAEKFSYGQYGPLHIIVEKNKTPEIVLATQLADKIDYISIEPSGDGRYYNFSHTDTKSCGTYSATYSSSQKEPDKNIKPYVERMEDALSQFVGKFVRIPMG